jgi:hypothetical protein
LVLLSGSDAPTAINSGERGPLRTEKLGPEDVWACQVDDLEDAYLTVFARSIDLEQHNLLAMAMGEQSRLTAYRFLNVLFPSMLEFFTERVTGRSSTQAILGEIIGRPGEDRRLLDATRKGFAGPHARAIARSKALKLRYGCQGSRLS